MITIDLIFVSGKDCCEYCGRPFVGKMIDGKFVGKLRPTKEHRIPKVRGFIGYEKGEDATIPMGVSCHQCNYLKNDMTEDEYLYFLENRAWAESYKDYRETLGYSREKNLQTVVRNFRKIFEAYDKNKKVAI